VRFPFGSYLCSPGLTLFEAEPEPEKQEVVADPTKKPEPEKKKEPEKKPEKPIEKPKPKPKEKPKEKPKNEVKAEKAVEMPKSLPIGDKNINSTATANSKATTTGQPGTNGVQGGSGTNTDELNAYRAAIRREIERHKRYPARAKMMRKQGIVSVSFSVGTDGSLSGERVTNSSGDESLDNAALEAVRSARPVGPKPAGFTSSVSVPISFTMAALGGEIEVPTLDGRVKLKIPEETQTGKLFRMRGKGVTSRGGYTGDLICRIVVETPVKLNEEQKALLRKLEESLEGQTKQRPKSSSFLDGVKRFFDDLTK